jgi:pyrimidine-specific ribonucleoside hydrolase
MGGSAGIGNVTPVAEFNVWYDPEAADIVFRSGIPIWMCGLNLTHQAAIEAAVVERFARLGTHAAQVASSLLRFLVGRMQSRFGVTAAAMHDPCAVAILLEPSPITWAPMHVSVELRGEHTCGMTVCDARHVRAFNPLAAMDRPPAGPAPNANVAVSLDHSGFVRLLEDALTASP